MASDLIYREDAKDFVRHAYRKGLNPVEYLDEVPAADVADVVRCKDCRFFHNGYDEKCCTNHKGVVVADENGFCHHAKRRCEDG